jgi:hypothetical protein
VRTTCEQARLGVATLTYEGDTYKARVQGRLRAVMCGLPTARMLVASLGCVMSDAVQSSATRTPSARQAVRNCCESTTACGSAGLHQQSRSNTSFWLGGAAAWLGPRSRRPGVWCRSERAAGGESAGNATRVAQNAAGVTHGVRVAAGAAAAQRVGVKSQRGARSRAWRNTHHG